VAKELPGRNLRSLCRGSRSCTPSLARRRRSRHPERSGKNYHTAAGAEAVVELVGPDEAPLEVVVAVVAEEGIH
jgi:hypothetical protein